MFHTFSGSAPSGFVDFETLDSRVQTLVVTRLNLWRKNDGDQNEGPQVFSQGITCSDRV